MFKNIIGKDKSEPSKVDLLNEKLDYIIGGDEVLSGSVAYYLQSGLSLNESLSRANDVDMYSNKQKYRFGYESPDGLLEAVPNINSPGWEKRVVKMNIGGRLNHRDIKMVFLGDMIISDAETLIQRKNAIIFFQEEQLEYVIKRTRKLIDAYLAFQKLPDTGSKQGTYNYARERFLTALDVVKEMLTSPSKMEIISPEGRMAAKELLENDMAVELTDEELQILT